jgi:hypothetical protein
MQIQVQITQQKLPPARCVNLVFIATEQTRQKLHVLRDISVLKAQNGQLNFHALREPKDKPLELKQLLIALCVLEANIVPWALLTHLHALQTLHVLTVKQFQMLRKTRVMMALTP